MRSDDAGGISALNGPLPSDPPWLQRAWEDIGKQETPGALSAAWIMALPKRFAAWVQEYYRTDAIPWCALWLSTCLKDVGINAPANPLGAAAYIPWGQSGVFYVPGVRAGAVRIPSIGICRRGSIVVLKRLGGHHVGFLLDYDTTTGKLILLSGNSRDRVGVDAFDFAKLVAVRYPA